jgi:hypothetical protein
MGNIENKLDEIKISLLELVEMYNEANKNLTDKSAPSTIIRKTITEKEKIESILYNRFGENLVYTDEYSMKKNAKLIDFHNEEFNIDKAEVNFHKQLEGKLFNSLKFVYDEQSGGCWLMSDELNIALNSFYGEDNDNPEKFGILVSFLDGDFNEYDIAKREWIDYPEPLNNEDFEKYKLFYLELLEKYSSKDLVD